MEKWPEQVTWDLVATVRSSSLVQEILGAPGGFQVDSDRVALASLWSMARGLVQKQEGQEVVFLGKTRE